MTLSEFKAWFEGFTEDLAGPPNKKQWERIKVRVGEITGQPISYPVYIDRYVRPNPLYGPIWTSLYGVGQSQGVGQVAQGVANAAFQGASQYNMPTQAMDSHAAMNALGRFEAKEVN